jgi:hypothetical protein
MNNWIRFLQKEQQKSQNEVFANLKVAEEKINHKREV